MELTNGAIELKPVKLLDMNTKKVWYDKNNKQNKKHIKQKKEHVKKDEVIYTKEMVLSIFKKYGGQFVYFPAFKDDDIPSEGYLLAAVQEDSKIYYYYLDKNRIIQKLPATRVLEFRNIPSEFFVIKWLTENQNEELYNYIYNYFKGMELLTTVYFKLIKERKIKKENN